MIDAAISAIVVALVSVPGTFYATRALVLKNHGDRTQAYADTLLRERTDLMGRLTALEASVKRLQDDHEAYRFRSAELFHLDQRIRHDGSALIRNVLTVVDEASERYPNDPAFVRPDLRQRAQVLERLRDVRREAQEKSLGIPTLGIHTEPETPHA